MRSGLSEEVIYIGIVDMLMLAKYPRGKHALVK